MKNNFDYKPRMFKKALFQYVQKIHPEWAERTVQTHISDGMFVKNALSESTLNQILSNDVWTDELESYLTSIIKEDMLADRKYVNNDTKKHVQGFRTYFEFIQIVAMLESAKLGKPRDIRGVNNGNT